MKIDVEGQVLHGAEQILREKHPTLLIEFHTGARLQRFGYTKRELETFLKELGYTQSWEKKRGCEMQALYE